MKAKLLIGMSAIAFGFGCGDDSLSEEDSQKGFAATQSVLAQGGAQAQAQAGGLVSVDFTFNCLEGGTAQFVGEFDETSDSEGTFNYTVTFSSCVSQGVTLTGDVAYEFNYASTDTSGSFSYTYVGSIGFAGDVNGECDIDMSASFSAEENGSTGSVNYSYSGTLCGNDAGFMNSGSVNITL